MSILSGTRFCRTEMFSNSRRWLQNRHTVKVNAIRKYREDNAGWHMYLSMAEFRRIHLNTNRLPCIPKPLGPGSTLFSMQVALHSSLRCPKRGTRDEKCRALIITNIRSELKNNSVCQVHLESEKQERDSCEFQKTTLIPSERWCTEQRKWRW